MLLGAGSLTLAACNDFLDELPDNRTELDTPDKINRLLVSAYPSRSFTRMCEIASDNCDDMGANNPNTSLLLEHNSYWMDMNEAENDSNKNTWQAYYSAIAAANTALEAIEKQGTPKELLPAKAEALLCRAYSHFCLTMLYCLPYHPEKSGEYLGVPYMEAPETTLNPVYHRDNLKEVYEKIDRDIEEALPLVSDANYAVPKYHFNRSAAYAFATRFNLYYLKWEKVVEYASEVLGSAPSTVMRDWAAVKQLAWDGSVRTLDYISVGHSFNLLMIPMVTGNGSLFNAWSNSGARFTHNYRVAKRETYRAKRPMGGPWDRWKDNCIEKVYQHPPFIWQDNDVNKIYMPKWPNQWEVTDPVTGVGIGRSTMVAFTTNETVLSRAEAYVHLKEYDKAVADLNAWIGSFWSDRTASNL